MRKDIEDYIGSCLQCASHNIVRKKILRHLTSFEPPADIFQMLHMYFWGPVRCSKDGNRHVHGFSVSYHPETNGQVERFNATFCTQLAKNYDEGEDDWDEYCMRIILVFILQLDLLHMNLLLDGRIKPHLILPGKHVLYHHMENFTMSCNDYVK